MKALRYFTAVFAIAALASCNDDLDMGGFASDPNAVRISATVGKIPTRSNPVGDATTVKQFNAGDKMYVSSNSLSAVYEFDGTSWSPVIPEQYLTWNSAKQNFTAYYPDTYRGSGNVPQDQSNDKKISVADYMKFEGDLEMQETVSFTMSRQTARVIIRNDFSWNDEYMEGVVATHKVDAIMVNCIGVSDIKPYQSGNYYALVNSGSADPDATFLTITVSPIDGQGSSVTHTVRGIPEFEPGYSYEYDITIGKSGVTISDVTVEDWSTGSILGGEGGMDDNTTKTFSVSVPQDNFTFIGGTKNYIVTSYVQDASGNKIATPWNARFVRKLQDDTYEEIKKGEDDYPTWITSFTEEGIGDNTDDIFMLTVAAENINNNHYKALKNSSPISGIYNLANLTGGDAIENTANCYIINAPGTYSFPLVYGNAIKNGADNKSAYISTAVGANALENFVNHNNDPIISPYIAAHTGCVPDNATLIWQDADNLVSNIKFVDGGSPEAHRITFDVDQATIKQGNAVIAIRDVNNAILWSWHIWVTDYKPGLDATIMASYDPTQTQRDKEIWTYDNTKSYTLMGVPLGWCDAESSTGHEVIIQFTQTVSGETQEVVIKQEPLSVGGNCTYYQWGRKDPMLGSNGFGNTDKAHYSADYPFTKSGAGKATIGKAIQNPNIFYDYGAEGYLEWCDNEGTVAGKDFLYNMWDTHYIDILEQNKYTMTTKTIYDPSPVGYVVPPSGAFSGITYNSQFVDFSEGNGTWEQVNSPFKSFDEEKTMGGCLYYCKGMNSNLGKYNLDGGVVFFPSVGQRTDTGELYGVSNGVNFLASNSYINAFSYCLTYEYGLGFSGNGATRRVYGEPVRPVRER